MKTEYKMRKNYYKKENNFDNLNRTLENYYNLAILVVLCYGSHDCKSGVAGYDYDLAIKR